jgi:rubrerythrin
MAVIFSAREIVEAAVEKERKRREFYARVSALSADEEMRKLFQFLTAEEDRHVAAFTKIRDSLPREEYASEEYSEDMQAYMDSVIDDRLYARIDSEEFVQQAIDAHNVFRLAIGFEKDAILYFREFLPFVTESEGQVVKDLIEQEKGHIRMLADMEKKMAG